MPVLGVTRSVSDRLWELRQADDRCVAALAQQGVSETAARLLATRGIVPDTLDAFLHPTLKEHLPHPFSLKDMEKAARRMAAAVLAGEPIGLMGDYDVDGATSTALLKLFLENVGVTVHTFIPDRDDGYGPNAKKMETFYAAGCRVVATLDCGTTAFEPIAAGTRLGLDVIILDHHDTEFDLPDAYAIVNPKRLDEPKDHPCRYMAAVGVVFLFTVALNRVLRESGFYKNRPEPDLISYLDLVAFGTVCDVVRLSGVNRLFVKSGLKQMHKRKNTGLNALAVQVNLNTPPTAYHLGFVFGPRINACGRVGKSDIGMQLLSCHDTIKAGILAGELEELNLRRRDIESAVFLEALEQVESTPLADPFIVVKGHNWHQGVVGIVAGRLKDKYNLPTFALSIEGDDVKGSSRSIDGVDLGSIVMNALTKGILTRGGGHPRAAGFSLKADKVDDFIAYLRQVITPDSRPDALRILDIDAVLDIRGATPALTDELALLAPFGEANPEPVFALKNVLVNRAILLKNGHIACTLTGRGGGNLQAIAFRAADTELGIRLLTHKNEWFHVAGYLKQDSWHGKTKIQLQILDLATAVTD